MKKILFFTVALCLVASTAFAGSEGRMGIGATWGKDVSIFYGLASGAVVSGGISFSSMDSGVEGSDSATDFRVGAAYEHPLKSGDKAQFNLDLGLDFASEDMGEESQTTITPHVGFNIRFWFSDSFSVSAAHGLAIDLISPPGDADSRTNIGTYSANFSDVQFTYWFEAK